MKIIQKLDSVLDHVEKGLCLLLLGVMCLVILIQIVLRILNVPLSWTEELARYCFVWSIYIGASHAARLDRHLKVDIFQLFLKKRGKFVFNMIMNVSAMVFFVILAVIMSQVLAFFNLRPQTSAALKINMIYAYAAPFVCSVLCVIRYGENIIREIVAFQQPESPQEGA